MKVLVNYTEVISDNYQGGSGKVYDRSTIIEISGEALSENLFELCANKIAEDYQPFMDANDRKLIRLNNVVVFK